MTGPFSIIGTDQYLCCVPLLEMSWLRHAFSIGAAGNEISVCTSAATPPASARIGTVSGRVGPHA